MITDPKIVQVVHGSSTPFTKSDFYYINSGYVAVHNMHDHVEHDRRRSFGWDEAFSSSSLRSYDGILKKHVRRLMAQLDRRLGQSIDIRDWLGYFAFDFIGDLGFGRDFQALEKGEAHWYMEKLRGHGGLAGLFSTMGWFVELLLSSPVPDSLFGFIKLLDYAAELAKPDPESKSTHKSLMSQLLDADQFYNDKIKEERLIAAESRLVVVAGSDTTSGRLTHVFYYLAKKPDVVRKLRQELEETPRALDAPLSQMAHTPYLNAVIFGTMQLHPAVPGGGFRTPPKQGFSFKGRFIPGSCVVVTPPFVIQRSPKAFRQPDEFIPERWTTRPELILDRSAHFPFGAGRYACIGKQLAYTEMRCVIARTVSDFDVRFADNEDGSGLIDSSTDQFTLGTESRTSC